MIKVIRRIQLNKISYSPQLFTTLNIKQIHPTQYDESDDIEYQKQFIKKDLATWQPGNRILYNN